MSLQIVAGRSGTGKTTYCMAEIARKQEDRNGRLIFIVPEQYSSQAEQDLIQQTGGKGLLTAEVLSFGRLAHMVFSKYGLSRKMPMSDTGKAMTLRKILLDLEGDFRFFHKAIDKQGFVEQLGRTVTELFQYHITPEMLEKWSQNPQLSQMMQDKILDLEKIYQAYGLFIQKDYICGDTMLDLLADKLSSPEILGETEFWLDGFYGFTPQEYLVIGRLMQLGKKVTVTLTIDDDTLRQKGVPISSPFYEPFLTVGKLKRTAESLGVRIEEPIVLTENHRAKRKALWYLEQDFFYGYRKSFLEYKGIHIYAAVGKDGEIRQTACQMIRLARDYGLRYREMAVVTNALQDYEKSIQGIFREYEIPYFIDAKREILSHPLVELVRSVVDCVVTHLNYESVFRYLKTGLSLLTRDEVDLLENYVLAYGIKGYKWYRKPWEFGFSKEEETERQEMNRLRETALFPLNPLLEGVKRKKQYTVKEMAVVLGETLNRLGIAEKMEEWAAAAKTAGKEVQAREHQQIWTIVIGLLEKMVSILGEERMTVAEFAKILEAGLSNSDMGIIPPTVDSVLVGDLERSRLPQIKVLFVLGVNEGILPSASGIQGIFTDMERDSLETMGVELASGGKRRVFEEQFLIYSSITKPSHILFLTYCASDLEGKAMRPSSLIGKMSQMFPKMSLFQEDKEQFHLEDIASPAAAFHTLGQQMRRAATGERMDTLWKDVLSFYNRAPKWQKRVKMLEEGLLLEGEKERLSQKTVKKMYGDTVFSSVSRLERYAACPFSYFVEYGLKAKERRLYELRVPDLGMLFHEVLEGFSRNIEEGNKSWFDITKEETEEIINKAVEEAVPRLGNEILLDSAANRYLIHRLKRISRRAAWTLVEHIQMGDFEPYGFEIGFGEENYPPIVLELEQGEKLILNGKIDRIDIMSKEGHKYVKIIDYKSGSKDFDYQLIYYGLQLQLFIYMDAFLNKQGTEQWKPGGVFYFRVKDPSVKMTTEMAAEEIYQLIFKDMKMSGLVLDNPEVIQGLDHTLAGADGKLVKGRSAVIPMEINKDGTYSKRGTSVADEESYQRVMDFAIQKAKEAGRGILDGEIAPKPYRRKNETPCSYCAYYSVCRFDTIGGNYHDLKKVAEGDFWSIVNPNRQNQEKE